MNKLTDRLNSNSLAVCVLAHSRPLRATLVAIIALAIASCGDMAKLPVSAGVGPNPQIPEPEKSLLPTVDIAPAKGWPQNAKPVAANGVHVNRFADDLQHPRSVYVLPNGDVLACYGMPPVGNIKTTPIREIWNNRPKWWKGWS